MWDCPPIFLAGSGTFALELTADSLASEYNLYNVLGQPVSPVNVTLTINGAVRVASVVIDRFAPGSAFEVILLNGAQLIGRGGAGGDGGVYESEPGFTLSIDGGDGLPGGAALKTDFSISLNMDDGYAFGGGGGGGGGAGGQGAFGGGSGGGGGRGWNNAPGGTGGNDNTDGAAGSILAAGAGGADTLAGGAGGNFGVAGNAGANAFGGSDNGVGGAKGYGVYLNVGGLTVTLTGAKSKATIDGEGRIAGDWFLNGGSVVDP